jgi:hypothetical protein
MLYLCSHTVLDWEGVQDKVFQSVHLHSVGAMYVQVVYGGELDTFGLFRVQLGKRRTVGMSTT